MSATEASHRVPFQIQILRYGRRVLLECFWIWAEPEPNLSIVRIRYFSNLGLHAGVSCFSALLMPLNCATLSQCSALLSKVHTSWHLLGWDAVKWSEMNTSLNYGCWYHINTRWQQTEPIQLCPLLSCQFINCLIDLLHIISDHIAITHLVKRSIAIE